MNIWTDIMIVSLLLEEYKTWTTTSNFCSWSNRFKSWFFLAPYHFVPIHLVPFVSSHSFGPTLTLSRSFHSLSFRPKIISSPLFRSLSFRPLSFRPIDFVATSSSHTDFVLYTMSLHSFSHWKSRLSWF